MIKTYQSFDDIEEFYEEGLENQDTLLDMITIALDDPKDVGVKQKVSSTYRGLKSAKDIQASSLKTAIRNLGNEQDTRDFEADNEKLTTRTSEFISACHRATVTILGKKLGNEPDSISFGDKLAFEVSDISLLKMSEIARAYAMETHKLQHANGKPVTDGEYKSYLIELESNCSKRQMPARRSGGR